MIKVLSSIECKLKKNHYSNHILWAGSHFTYKISERWEIAIPAFFEEIEKGNIRIEQIVCRLTDWGCNKLMIGASEAIPVEPSAMNVDVIAILKQFREKGIEVVIKPRFLGTFSPFDPELIPLWSLEIGEWLSRAEVDSLFWSSYWSEEISVEDALAGEKTYYEWHLEEMRILEQVVAKRCSLIYFMPIYSLTHAALQSSWLAQIVDDAAVGTTIAFASVAGSLYKDHLAIHPFWEQLQREPYPSATPMLPIINSGSVGQGEGLWPALSFDLAARFYPRMQRHPFDGVIHMVNRLPEEGSLLDLNLWVAGQALIGKGDPHLFAETWLGSHGWGLERSWILELLELMRGLVIELSYLKEGSLYSPEVFRVKGEKILIQLKEISLLASFLKKEDKVDFLLDSIPYFIRDIKKLTLHYLEKLHVPIAHSLSEEEAKGAFWCSGKNVKGMSPEKMVCYEQPRYSSDDPTMTNIFKKNRLF